MQYVTAASLLVSGYICIWTDEGWTKHTNKLLVAVATTYGEAGRLMSEFCAAANSNVRCKAVHMRTAASLLVSGYICICNDEGWTKHTNKL